LQQVAFWDYPARFISALEITGQGGLDHDEQRERFANDQDEVLTAYPVTFNPRCEIS
jgi:hypothetical protein